MTKELRFAGRSLSKGEEHTGTQCPVCDGERHEVTLVHKSMAMIRCLSCGNTTTIERPLLFKTPCPMPTTA